MPHMALTSSGCSRIIAHALADRIKIFPGTNPGCLLDEHKRSDSIYLRRKWIELRDVDSRCMSAKITAVNEALDLCNACPTQENLTKCEQARAELAAYRDTIKKRNEAKKFAADLYLSERATRYFFREPQQDSLQLVQEYANAAGLVLNMRKTSIMPFTHHVSQDKLSRLRSSTPLHVLDIGDSTKLLGVLPLRSRSVSTQPSLRLESAAPYGISRTLRGKVVLLQSIILPLFWYTACVTAVSPPILKVLDAIIRNFVHGNDITGSTAASGKFDKGWIYTPVLDGGLGLTPPKKFIQAMHLKCLRDGMVCTYTMCRAPRWILPALELFSTALGSLGESFDILYANMRGTRWYGLASFWRMTLRLWADLNDTYGTTNWKPFVQVMPFWYNLHFTFGKANSPLSDVSKPTNSALKSLGFSRLQDYVDRYGTYVTKEIILNLLDVSTFARPASRTRLVTDPMTRFNLLLPQDGPRYGPMRSPLIESACHDWSLNGMLVINKKNRDFVHLLSTKLPDQESVPLPMRQLDVPSFHPSEDMWRKELMWDRYVLPVFSDVKYRLQHNAIRFLYKFQWRTQVTSSHTCVHECEPIETVYHLFWSCCVAKDVWNYFLPAFGGLTESSITWNGVLFPSVLRVHPKTTQDYGDRIFWVVFHVVRCCVLRAIWLHRNKRLYNSDITTSAPFVQQQARSYVILHLRKIQEEETYNGRRKRVDFLRKMINFFGSSTSTIPTSTSTLLRLRRFLQHPQVQRGYGPRHGLR
ncbi:hypothetical protein PsorP6_010814 [Peronosclerospora sorghi]|uniref:Uncharacterized protein n=1 Tax=Peronosclerospora sorghi TaxID=230839 RepID=A0ACC0VWL8_9STRA|nr:hypothetical protein PsorP6_010814 [Peronosclerospora sorghi]